MSRAIKRNMFRAHYKSNGFRNYWRNYQQKTYGTAEWTKMFFACNGSFGRN